MQNSRRDLLLPAAALLACLALLGLASWKLHGETTVLAARSTASQLIETEDGARARIAVISAAERYFGLLPRLPSLAQEQAVVKAYEDALLASIRLDDPKDDDMLRDRIARFRAVADRLGKEPAR